MKILYLTNLYAPYNFGHDESICASVDRAMQARGHQTLVLTSNHGVKKHGLPAGESHVRRDLRLHGFLEYPHLGIMRLRRLELHNNRLLRKAIQDFRPDVVHVFNLRGLCKSLALTLQRIDIPTIYFIAEHGLGRSLAADVWLDWWNREPRNFQQRALRDAWTAAGRRQEWDLIAPTQHAATLVFKRICFASELLRRQAIEAGHDVAHGEVIYHGVDTIRFNGPVAPKTQPLRRFLYTGPLAKDRGVLTLLRAMTLLRDKFQGELTLCGQGEPDFEAELREMVAKQKLPIHFRTAANENLPAIYREHHALIYPSEREEPFALTPLEAMASGLPVIATATEGNAEYFRNRVNALTYTAGDENELAQQIFWLQGVPSLREGIARAGQEDVRTLFSEEVVMGRIDAYVRETVGSWSRFSPDRSRLKAPAQQS